MNGSTESTGTRFNFLDLKNYPVSGKTVSLRELGNQGQGREKVTVLVPDQMFSYL
jgi:hypothetical protein